MELLLLSYALAYLSDYIYKIIMRKHMENRWSGLLSNI